MRHSTPILKNEKPVSPSKLILGTVQLGLQYGVNNTSPKPNDSLAEKIVLTAIESGITIFDTAQSYGDSEQRLGAIIKAHQLEKKVKIISKLAPSVSLADYETVIKEVTASINRLGVPNLHALLVHSEMDLKHIGTEKEKTISHLIQEGLAEHVGGSLYTPEIGLQALKNKLLSYFQVPANILDHRFKSSGFINCAIDQGVTIDIRSIFLQGLLLMNPFDLPNQVQHCSEILKKLQSCAADSNYSIKELAVAYVKDHLSECNYVIGAENDHQVKENAELFSNQQSTIDWDSIFMDCKTADPRILNPALWS